MTRLVLCWCLVLMPTLSWAVTYYVAATGGNDSNTCTQAQNISTPKASFSGGAGCLSAGDTLLVRTGTYTASNANSIPSGSSASWSAATTIARYQAEVVTLQSIGSGDQVLHFSNGNNYIILDGLILNGGHDGLKVSDPSHHIRFINGEIKNHLNQGVLLGGPGGNEFLNCSVHDGGTDSGFDHGFYIADEGDGVLDNCEIYNNTKGYGIHMFGAIGSSDGWVFRRLKIHGNLYGVLLQDGEQVLFYNNLIYSNQFGIRSNNNNSLWNNTIYNNDGFGGIHLAGGVGGNMVENNIVVGNDQASGVWIEAGANTFRNNLVANNGSVNLDDDSGQTTSSANLIGNEHDPAFTNAASADFTLQSTSAARNAGRTLATVTTDFVGTTRPQGAVYDIGAYEFVEATGIGPGVVRHLRFLQGW